MDTLSFILAGLLSVSCVFGVYLWITKRMEVKRLHQKLQRLEDSRDYLTLSAELMRSAISANSFPELESALKEILPQFNLPLIWKVEVSENNSPYLSVASDTYLEIDDVGDCSTFLKESKMTVGSGTITFWTLAEPAEENFHFELIGGEIWQAVNQLRNSFTDALTGLWSRQYLMMRMEEELKRAQRHHHWVSLMMLDGDRFKQINDNYGHDAGDLVIQRVAEVLKGIHHRGSDIVARFGGDEFLVLLPETRPVMALENAERTREILSGQTIKTDAGDIIFSCSIGLYSVLPAEIPVKADQVLQRADQALYAAKTRGRNCVVAHKDGSSRGKSGQ